MSHGGSDHIDYYDPFQTDKWLSVVSDSEFQSGRAKGYMLISVGPDQYLGVYGGAYGDLTTTAPLGLPPELTSTVGTERFFYDPTNGTISTGNLYRFSGGLTQKDLLTSIQ